MTAPTISATLKITLDKRASSRHELTDCGVSGYSASTGGDNPSESISLNFAKVMVTPSPLDTAGTPVKGAVVTYDLTKLLMS